MTTSISGINAKVAIEYDDAPAVRFDVWLNPVKRHQDRLAQVTRLFKSLRGSYGRARRIEIDCITRSH